MLPRACSSQVPILHDIAHHVRWRSIQVAHVVEGRTAYMWLEPILGQAHAHVRVHGQVRWIGHPRRLMLLLQMLIRHCTAAEGRVSHAGSTHILCKSATQLLLHACTCIIPFVECSCPSPAVSV